ncbi:MULTISPECIES: hypothetical protein [unclassified Streptococcus]|uniref:hypothetical protein n=1 Tax=unclassified Streptococcus TaxID=2608887 RepID=UPI00211B177A|nr:MULTISPECIES: hypothetical protein [unclassified Streptococcus]MCQ9212380.1 hypothetical protein [Streptococcus sp. B01]MCQ9213719.1 hypothetical protein [Streptococcus sp. O1]MCQ9214519.1 hypothetical protein [Streptococcus sp. O1]
MRKTNEHLAEIYQGQLELLEVTSSSYDDFVLLKQDVDFILKVYQKTSREVRNELCDF